MQITPYSEPGGHPHNEDAFEVRRISDDPETWVVALADGQGGQAGGARAARLACEAGVERCGTIAPEELMKPVTWERILADVDRAVCDDPEAGLTTLVAFCIGSERICGASNGDSAAVLLEESRSVTLTSRQPKNPPVGSGEAAFACFDERLTAPWKVLAMSDGVWKYATWQGVNDVLQTGSGEDGMRSLRDRAALPVSGGLQDDFTAVLIEGTPGRDDHGGAGRAESAERRTPSMARIVLPIGLFFIAAGIAALMMLNGNLDGLPVKVFITLKWLFLVMPGVLLWHFPRLVQESPGFPAINATGAFVVWIIPGVLMTLATTAVLCIRRMRKPASPPETGSEVPT